MSEELPKNTKIHLALALAQGYSASKWAHANAVPKNTAYRWARKPEVRKAIQAHRRRLIDEAVGRMTKGTTEAAGFILNIASEAKTGGSGWGGKWRSETPGIVSGSYHFAPWSKPPQD
jgi:hypothetical protein